MKSELFDIVVFTSDELKGVRIGEIIAYKNEKIYVKLSRTENIFTVKHILTNITKQKNSKIIQI